MKVSTIQEFISKIDDLNDDLVIYAKKVDGKFTRSSEAVILQLTEKEQGMPTYDIAQKKCPGFDYFLEIFIIKEVLEGFVKSNSSADLIQKADRIIYYAEFDA